MPSMNGFVLKQGIREQHALLMCSICAVSDAVLISLGGGGIGAIVHEFPSVEIVARYVGALSLFV